MKYLNVNSISIDPRIWNALPLEAIVENGSVSIECQSFSFDGGDGYPDGTKVLIQRNRNIYCQSLAEIEAEKVDRERRRIEVHLESQAKDRERIARAKEFNEALRVPVNWSPEVKHVLSGLSENSNGDGRRRNTRVHVYLRESLEGTLKRNANSFLCSPSRGSHYNELIHDGEYSKLEAVTCSRCLEISKRWQ